MDENFQEVNVFLNLLHVLEDAVAEDNQDNSSSYIEEDRAIRKVIMVSQRYFHSFFDDLRHSVLMKVGHNYQDFDLFIRWNKINFIMEQLNAKTTSALIRLSKLEQLGIVMYVRFDTHQVMGVVDVPKAVQSWAQVCRALKG